MNARKPGRGRDNVFERNGKKQHLAVKRSLPLDCRPLLPLCLLAGKAYHENGMLGSYFKFGKDGGDFYLGACQPDDDPRRGDQVKCRGSFQGAIAEVRIYKRALGDAEVAALYQAYQQQAVED